MVKYILCISNWTFPPLIYQNKIPFKLLDGAQYLKYAEHSAYNRDLHAMITLKTTSVNLKKNMGLYMYTVVLVDILQFKTK